MTADSYAKTLEGMLKSARESEPEATRQADFSDRDELLRAVALIAVLSMENVTDERGEKGRQLGAAWSQDHRRTLMGADNVLEHRRKRSTWR